MLKNYVPIKWRKFLPYYWFFVLMYCAPFFFTFMLFKHEFSLIWQLNTMSALVWMVLLADVVSLFVITTIGFPLGWLLYLLTTSEIVYAPNYSSSIILFSSIFLFSAIFAFKKEKFQKEKLLAIRSLAGSIAHELRTPLKSISLGVNAIRKYTPDLIYSYQLAKNANIEVPLINPLHYGALVTTCNDVESEVRSAFTVIDMLLTNVNQSVFSSLEIKICSIMDCLNESVSRYPFDQKELEWIHIEDVQDFSFMGDKIAIIHLFFNLFKNAIYYIRASNKKDAGIFISTTSGKKFNYLHFKDTATGISPKILPYIFDQFFSRTFHGAGIGLAFCKHVMEAIGGSIRCQSVEGEYTEFLLIFPKIS